MDNNIALGKYQHYKGNFYEVIGVALHSETLEEYVVYRPLYKTEKEFEGKLWIRPKKMFLESVVLNGISVPRFKFIE